MTLTIKELFSELSGKFVVDPKYKKRQVTFDFENNVILVFKTGSELGYSISINRNKKKLQSFASFNLIRKNNYFGFEKVTSLGKPVPAELEQVENMFNQIVGMF